MQESSYNDCDAPEFQCYNSEDECDDDEVVTDGVTRLYIFFLLLFQSTFRISDTALNVLLQFLSMLFLLLASKFQSDELKLFAINLPRNVKAAKYCYTKDHEDFTRYTSCPNCFSTYHSNQQVTKCSYVQFPKHPMASYRQPCNTVLVKSVKNPSQSITYQPKHIYCYRSVTTYLKELLMHPGFIQKCEQWRNRPELGRMCDVYDGKVWRDFLDYEGKPFLSLPFNFALHLNVDWYQPFEHTQHSEGAIYLTVLNLPREERYHQHNVMLIGVIPGPREPKQNINSFLKPFVEDMLSLWKGVVMKTEKNVEVLVRAALLCAGCDIPAARKVCGFVGHGGYRGCSKCSLTFPTEEFGQKADYSDTNIGNWPPRSKTEHKEYAQAHKCCNTRSEQKKIERDSGVRYSILNELPYFDPPRMCIVDPMHNLLLGTSKHMMEIWKQLGLIGDKEYPVIHNRLATFTTPNDVGRLPSRTKILSGFAGFTAEEWKNWTIFFSLFLLKDLLPSQHYNCWHHFVKGCFLLCRRTITTAELDEAHEDLMNFFSEFVTIYGKDQCNMNIHLHGHLKECVLDYGPVYSFWLFAFERLNGILGSYHTNNRNISVQIMSNFMDSHIYSSSKWPQDYVKEFLPILDKFKYYKGSLQQSTFESAVLNSEVKPLPPVLEISFTPIELSYIKELLGSEVLMLYKKTKAIKLKNYVIGSKNSRSSKASFVLTQNHDEATQTLLEINYFAQCSIEGSPFWIAAVTMYMEHPCRYHYGYPVQVWTITPSSVSFIPISAIKSRVVFAQSRVNFGNIIGEETVHVIVPLESN